MKSFNIHVKIYTSPTVLKSIIQIKKVYFSLRQILNLSRLLSCGILLIHHILLYWKIKSQVDLSHFQPIRQDLFFYGVFSDSPHYTETHYRWAPDDSLLERTSLSTILFKMLIVKVIIIQSHGMHQKGWNGR